MQFTTQTKASQTNMRRLVGSIPHSYTVFEDDSEFYAESNTPGVDDAPGDDLAIVLNSIIANNTSILLKGDLGTLTDTIHINGKDKVKLIGDWGKIRVIDNLPPLEITTSSHVKVRGLNLVGSSEPAKTLQTGIIIYDGCDDIDIYDNIIENMGYDGVDMLYGVTNSKIRYNRVSGCGDDGINPGGGGGAASSDILVQGNDVLLCTSDGIHASIGGLRFRIVKNNVYGCANGIGLNDCSYAIITGNSLYANGGGIVSEAGTCQRLNVSHNYVYGTSAQEGISLVHNAEFCTINDNHLQDVFAGKYSIYVVGSYAKANHNQIMSPGGPPIYLSSAHSEASHNNIYRATYLAYHGITLAGNLSKANDNILNNLDYGVNVLGDECTVNGNTVESCNRGIYSVGDGGTVLANILKALVDYGIVLSAANDNTVGFNVVNGCTNQSGIYVLGNDNTLQGNRCRGVYGVNGIYIAATSTDTIMVGNRATSIVDGGTTTIDEHNHTG